MYSLVSSAKANGAEPFAWLKELFMRLPYHRDGKSFEQAPNNKPVSSSELDYLLPDKWLAANPDHTSNQWHDMPRHSESIFAQK